MGLTIHYRLSAPATLSADEARELVRKARKAATRMLSQGKFAAVTPICGVSDREAKRVATHYFTQRIPGEKNTFRGIEVSPKDTFLFATNVGRDCEPLWIGLCRYPEKVYQDGRYRATRMGLSWQLRSFSKTQFASLHGWEHFARCHTAIIELLTALRGLGFGVKISDEGEYWPRRSLKALRSNVDQMNGIVAAAAGCLKDMDRKAGTPDGVQSPIFGHRDFERLEAEGAAQHERGLKGMRRALS